MSIVNRTKKMYAIKREFCSHCPLSGLGSCIIFICLMYIQYFYNNSALGARATFFSSRHRRAPHLKSLRHRTTAAFLQLNQRHRGTAPHLRGKKSQHTNNGPTKPNFEQNSSQQLVYYCKCAFTCTELDCLATDSFCFLKFRYYNHQRSGNFFRFSCKIQLENGAKAPCFFRATFTAAFI